MKQFSPTTPFTCSTFKIRFIKLYHIENKHKKEKVYREDDL